MIIRHAKQEEVQQLLKDGYAEWSKNRTFEQYCIDNLEHDSYATRYVLEVDGKICSSLIIISFNMINKREVLGIGSVLTHPEHRKKGFSYHLLKNCIEEVYDDSKIIMLYSDIDPKFYERLNFRVLPNQLHKSKKSPTMACCSDVAWEELIRVDITQIPDYF